MEALKKYREDSIKLLGLEIQILDPQAFYDYVVSLYQPRVAGGKAKESEIKGKKVKAPTKKAFGTYEMSFQTALGPRILFFTFDKRMLFREDFLKTVCEHLLCAEQKLRAFLEKKKFSISPCLDDEMKLQEIIIFTGDKKKETNNENPS